MKTDGEIERALDALVRAHYYAEDFELAAAFRAFLGGLDAEGRASLGRVIARRLAAGGSIVDVLLCGDADVPDAGRLLAALLDREAEASQMSRALIAALGRLGGAGAYRSVERFLDSEQEFEALAALAAIDFARTLGTLARRMGPGRFPDAGLHILHERRKRVGLDALAAELAAWAAGSDEAARRNLAAVLRAKEGRYSPLSAEEVRVLSHALRAPP